MKLNNIPERALVKGFPPAGLLVGLYVEYIEEIESNFSMTSFDIRFSMPGEPHFSIKYIDEIESKISKFLIKKGYDLDKFVYIKRVNTGFVMNIAKHQNNVEALNLVCDICKDILNLSKDELKYHDKIKDIINWYDELITKYNQYTYVEKKIVHKASDETIFDAKIVELED